MPKLYKIVISDYWQRTRSYAFLITLAISLYTAYSFVPAPDANYTTVRIGNYIGVQNAAWIGYVTAMMTSVFLCLTGFYLVNSNIKKDIQTGVGMIIATTSISNFSYLSSKAWSNFLVLLSITGIVFLMGITLFFVRSVGYPFSMMQFILPYLLITLPAIFFIAALSVAAEVLLYRNPILMNIGFFIFFCFLASQQTTTRPVFDLFGVKTVTMNMQGIIHKNYQETRTDVSIGFIFGEKKAIGSFIFEGIHWNISVILGRVAWICFGWLLIFLSSRFFHRFDIKEKFKSKRKMETAGIISGDRILHEIKVSELSPITPAYGITAFIRTEFKMLIRKGPRWLWLINLGAMVALIFAPLTIAGQIILPVLWFLQVGRWSDLASKEKTHRIHYFTYSSYKPLTRLLPAQMIAGILLALVLASPLMVRYLIALEFASFLGILLGGAFIVLLAVSIGIVSGGNKLFEIIFFLLTYLNVNRIPFADYFGGINHGFPFLLFIFLLITFLAVISLVARRIEIRNL
jgi:hypothetical protein